MIILSMSEAYFVAECRLECLKLSMVLSSLLRLFELRKADGSIEKWKPGANDFYPVF